MIIFVCMYKYMYAYRYMYVCMCIYIHIYIYMYMHACIWRVHIYIYMHIHIWTFYVSIHIDLAAGPSTPRLALFCSPCRAQYSAPVLAGRGVHANFDGRLAVRIRGDPCHGNTRLGAKKNEHEDPTNHDLLYSPYIGPWNQDVRSLYLGGPLGP